MTTGRAEPVEVTAVRPPRGTREATRERLVQAAIDLIRQGGISAVSTVSVTQAAGFAQSSFYMHFANVDECLKAAAEQVGEHLRVFIAANRRETQDRGEKEHFQTILSLFLQERQFAELLLRHRHDPSALGQVLGQIMEQIRTDLVADLWQLAQDMGVGEEDYDRVLLQSEFILASVLAAGEALLAGRVTNPTIVAEELCLLTQAIYVATQQRFSQK
jgi:AcrR family transcriptional regulator